MQLKRNLCFLMLLISFVSIARAQKLNELSNSEKKKGWALLFDGKTTNGWTTTGGKPVPAGWEIEDGNITAIAGSKGGDIITAKEYTNFELTVDYRIDTACNSGIKYFFTKYDEGGNLGMEYQILDDELAEDNKKANHLTGSLYDILAPSKLMKKVNPTGVWNTIRIVSENDRVQHWLNGFKVLEYKKTSERFKDAVALSKFSKTVPAFGSVKQGHILLQEHGGLVSFRNIKIRVIKP
ncbi:MAG TPA: DUF1080 domain-containing protein [Pedobacter sp.]|uniref:3-keto-disaccharide hydrolase n=1 Tax=Pedobacter sp. TaxID=1411316 RepID=UPI002CC1BA1D|nr:DUF1080 domain-containing protein [Pedobacter sp.]HMI03319.1 DUF1080 domain-containing protein [Pedobacter sp.]